ncbi:MAG: hypothetical protein OXD35_12215, partial [Thiotrichales bacterium]|nr:hypothetical protein [Thiotrichales bacterium]
IHQDDDTDDETFTIAFGDLFEESVANGVPEVELTVLDDDAPEVQEAPRTDTSESESVDLPPNVDEALEALIADIRAYAAETFNGAAHVERWHRVLYVLTDGAEGAPPAMTSYEAQTYADRGWVRWVPVVAALRKIEAGGRNPYDGLTISIADATAREGEEDLWFEVTLNRPAPGPVTVRAASESDTASSPNDFQSLDDTIRFALGEQTHRLEVVVHDDDLDEGHETMTVALSNPWPGMVTLARAVATGTIENTDPMPAAWLARFGRTVAEQALEGITGRMEAPRTPGMEGTFAGRPLAFAPVGEGGAAFDPTNPAPGVGDAPGLGFAPPGFGNDADGFGATQPGFGDADGFDSTRRGFGDDADIFGAAPEDPETMTTREALLGTSFTFTRAPDGAGGSLAFWGRATESRFSGGEETLSLDGEVTTALFGADYVRDRWLFGLALTRSEGEGGYTGGASGGTADPDCADDTGEATDLGEAADTDDATSQASCTEAAPAGDGKLKTSLTAAIPYASLQSSERLRLWGAAGYGAGEVTVRTLGERYRTDTDWLMAAAGMRGDLLEAPEEGSGLGLALTSDALWARTSSDKLSGMAASNSDVTRLRLGLEGSWRFTPESLSSLSRAELESDGHPGSGPEASFTPKLELGARHDGGDAETGFGVEFGGGVAWAAPSMGFSLDLSGRTLLAHENDALKDRGFSAAFAYDPDPETERGPSFRLSQNVGGQASGGLEALFTSASMEDRTGSAASRRWTVEAAYGLPAFGGRWIGSPHAGMELATGARDYTLGWRLTPEAANAPNLSLDLKALRRENDTVEPEHTVGVEMTLRW